MRRPGEEAAGDLAAVREKLSGEQEQAVTGLEDLLELPPPERHQWKARQPRVAAVVGARGSGKSTVLRRIRDDLDRESRFLCSHILDVSTIREDLGIMAMALDELMDMANVPRLGVRHAAHEGSYREFQGMRRSLHGEEINRQFEKCFQSAMLEEESHRRLAQDLAMSPGHYSKMIYEAAQRRRGHRSEFEEFVRHLLDFARQEMPDEAQRRTEAGHQEPQLVIFLDDLDLGHREMVHNWARALLTHYQNDSVLWLLSFDRDRLIKLLSHRLPGETVERVEHIDRFSGRALLQKLVPTHQQWELRRWPLEHRRVFCPLRPRRDAGVSEEGCEGSVRKLEELIQDRKLSHLLPLLPAYPRSLEGLYRRLDQGGKLSSAQFVRHVALGEGEDDLLQELDLRGIGLLTGSLRWDDEGILTNARWHAIVGCVENNAPLWGLPVPRELGNKIQGPEPEAFLEACLDVALAEGTLTPYQLLTRMPFTRQLLERTMAHLDFPGEDVVRALESPRIALRARQQRARPQNVALYWQLWSTASDAENRWECTIGPIHLWRSAYRFRSPIPSQLLRRLRLDRPVIEPIDQDGVSRHPFLPGSLRSLLLLVYRLQEAPWQDLDEKRKLWGPLEFTQVVVLFTLTAYLPRPATREAMSDFSEERKLWLDPVRLFSELVADMRGVEETLQSLLDQLNRSFAREADRIVLWDPALEEGPPETPHEAAQLELLCALDGLRRLSMVDLLAPGSRSLV